MPVSRIYQWRCSRSGPFNQPAYRLSKACASVSLWTIGSKVRAGRVVASAPDAATRELTHRCSNNHLVAGSSPTSSTTQSCATSAGTLHLAQRVDHRHVAVRQVPNSADPLRCRHRGWLGVTD
jgi:hypothetical protein